MRTVAVCARQISTTTPCCHHLIRQVLGTGICTVFIRVQHGSMAEKPKAATKTAWQNGLGSSPGWSRCVGNDCLGLVGGRVTVAKVLVDAPCSQTGALRRNPDMKWTGPWEEWQRPHKLLCCLREQFCKQSLSIKHGYDYEALLVGTCPPGSCEWLKLTVLVGPLDLGRAMGADAVSQDPWCQVAERVTPKC